MTTVTLTTDPIVTDKNLTITVSASAGYGGALSINQATGVVTATPANNGNFTITVTATDNCGVTSTATFTLSTITFDKAPVITSLSPNVGLPGTLVTVSGFNLDQVNTVRFNGMSAAFVIDSATQITATASVPAKATTGLVTAVISTGTATGPTFTVIQRLAFHSRSLRLPIWTYRSHARTDRSHVVIAACTKTISFFWQTFQDSPKQLICKQKFDTRKGGNHHFCMPTNNDRNAFVLIMKAAWVAISQINSFGSTQVAESKISRPF